MSEFKPDVMCLFVNAPGTHPELLGKIVVCRTYPFAYPWQPEVGLVVAIEGDCLPPIPAWYRARGAKHWVVPTVLLKPISDPELDTVEIEEREIDQPLGVAAPPACKEPAL